MFNKIFDFFKKDYEFRTQDKKFIKYVFDVSFSKNEKLNSDKLVYYVSVGVFLSRVSKNKELYNLYDSKVQQLLFVILSIKMKRVIGNDFPNLIQFVNYYANLKNDKVVLFDAVVKAIETYWGIDEFCHSEDKKGLLKPKILNTSNWKPQQETKYNEIVSIVFPEIKF